jgi:DNA primase
MKTFNRDIANKIYEYFSVKFSCEPYRNGWYKGDCPYCGKEKKFGLHIGKNKTNCFICGNHGSPINVIREVESLKTWVEVYSLLRGYEGIETIKEQVEVVLKPDNGIQLPESFTNIMFADGVPGKAAQAYLKSRGFDIMELAVMGVGYCWEGDYAGRIILPYYQDGSLVYYNARAFIPIEPKIKNPPIHEVGEGKTKVIFNADALQIYSTIRVVESVTNAITRGSSTIAIGGKSISEYQFNQILKSPCTSVILLLDPDAYAQSLELAKRLINYKRVKVVKLPEDKDVNDLGRKATRELEKAHTWETWQSLTRKLQNEKRTQLTY